MVVNLEASPGNRTTNAVKLHPPSSTWRERTYRRFDMSPSFSLRILEMST